jgi:hypothetical protein
VLLWLPAVANAQGPPPDWVIAVDSAVGGKPISRGLLGHYDLSGSLYTYDQVPTLVPKMQAAGFSDWRVGLGRWEGGTQILPTLSDGTPCAATPDQSAPPGSTDLDLIAGRDWFTDDGSVVTLADTLDESRYALDYVRSVLDTAQAFGVDPFVSVDLMPRALAVNRQPLRTACGWTYMNRVSNVRPRDPAVFAAAIVGLVQRIVEGSGGEPGRRATHWEIWNEPELPIFWDPAYENGPGPLDRFLEMAILALVELDAYRAGSANLDVGDLRFGLASFASAATAAAVLSGLDSAPLPGGSVAPLDFISFHGYSNDPLVIVQSIESVAAAAAISSNYQNVELVLAEWGPNLMTTAGDVVFASSMEPPLLMSTVIALGAAAGLDRAHHSIFWDFFPGNAITWGLLDHDANPRPLYRAYELLADVIPEGGERLEPVGLEDGRLDGGLGAVLVTRGPDGAVRAFFANRSPTSRSARLEIDGWPVSPSRVRRFDDPVGAIQDDVPGTAEFTVPARALVVAELAARLPGGPVYGRRLTVRDGRDASRRRIRLVSRDAAIASPTPGNEPSVAGATLRLQNPTTGEEAQFVVPGGESWRGLGRPAGSSGYRYLDSSGEHGPCRSIVVKPGRLLRVVCSGRNGEISFSLDEPSQGSLVGTLQFGTDRPYCAAFDSESGQVIADRGTSSGRGGLFAVKNAAAPSSCPAASPGS